LGTSDWWNLLVQAGRNSGHFHFSSSNNPLNHNGAGVSHTPQHYSNSPAAKSQADPLIQGLTNLESIIVKTDGKKPI